MKESTSATVLRVIFTVLMVITMAIASCAGALRITVLNPAQWEKLFREDDFKEALMEDMNYNEAGFYSETGYRIRDDEFFNELYDILVTEIFEILKYGESDLDEERFDEFFEEYLEGILEDDLNMSSSEVKAAKKDLYNDLQDSLDDASDEFLDDDSFGVVFKFQSSCVITAIVCLILTAAMFIPLIFIHKNKFTPVRNLGLAMLISQSMNAVCFTGLWAIIGSLIKDGAEGEIEECLADFWNKGTLPIFLGFAALAAVGLAIMIFGIAMKKNANKVNDIEAEA